MKGHKTSGDWSDVTSYGRNEIVFEGRHKEYGAYAMRQRYSHVLLLGLLVSISTGILCAGIPFVMNLINKHETVVQPDKDVVTIISDYHEHEKVIKQKEKIQPKQKIQQQKNDQTQNTNVVVARKPDSTDTVPTNKRQNLTDPGTTTVTTGTTGTTTIEKKPTDGTGQTDQPQLVSIAKNMPQFNGDLYKYIGEHLNYPVIARNNQVEGTAYVSFIVEADGSVSTVKIMRGVAGDMGLNDEAVRVIKELPAWKPGSQNGHPVRVQYTIPIKFQLK